MGWVNRSITLHSFLVLVNRHPEGGYIQPRRGIRQRCPLNPTIICLSDTLAICTTQADTLGLPIHMLNYLASNPLQQYGNDTTFITEGSTEEAWNLSTLLYLFTDCLGLQINHAKTAFVGGGDPMLRAGDANCNSTNATWDYH